MSRKEIRHFKSSGRSISRVGLNIHQYNKLDDFSWWVRGAETARAGLRFVQDYDHGFGRSVVRLMSPVQVPAAYRGKVGFPVPQWG